VSIAFVSVAAAGSGTTSGSPTYPATPAAGNLILCAISVKEPSSDPTNAAGLTLLTKLDGAAGGAVAANAGPTSVYLFYKVSDGTESGTVTFSCPGGDAMRAVMSLYSCTAGYTWDLTKYTSFEDTTSGTGVAIVGAAGINLAAGDMILGAWSGTRGNTNSTARSFSGSGMTFATADERVDSSNGTSPGCQIVQSDAQVTVGNNNAPTASYTLASTSVGPGIILRLREVAGGGVVSKLPLFGIGA
jgi:hypothetical protein